MIELVPTERIKLLNVGNKNEKEKQNMNNNLDTIINPSLPLSTPEETDPSIIYSSLTPELHQFKNLKKCTYLEFGSFPCYQKIYYCEICDPNNTEKICAECYTRCHGSCGNENPDDSKEDDVSSNNMLIIDDDLKKHDEFASFICECGKKLHVLNKKIENTKGTLCMFLELDYKLHNKAMYSCETCNVKTLCYICYLKCHGSKYNCVTKKKMTTDPFANKNKVCLCTHENHCSRIILNKFMNNIFQAKSNYDTIPFVWKSQILNCAFDGSIYQTLYEKVYSYILSFHYSTFDANGIDDIAIDTLSRFVINISKTKKFYYLHDNLIKVIPMNKLILLIGSFQNNHLVDYSIFISGLLNLFLVLHLKKDFQHIKSLSYKDFLITNSLDRINLRNYIYTRSIYTKEIIDKYTKKAYDNSIKYILPKICVDIIKLLIRAIKEYDSKSYDKFISSYMVILKIVYFCVKRFLFTKKQILKLIDVLEKFCLLFNRALKQLLGIAKKSSNKQDPHITNRSPQNGDGAWTSKVPQTSLSLISKILNYISKITHVIIVTYNDIIVSELMQQNLISISNNLDNIKSKFIHYITNPSKKLFKVITSTSLIYNTYLLNESISMSKASSFYIDVINFDNQSLEMFTLSDNLYYKHLSEVSELDYFYFERRKYQIETRIQFEESLKIRFEKRKNFPDSTDIINVINKDEYDAISIDEKYLNLNKLMIISTFNTTKQLESLLNLFFHAKIDYEKLDEQFHDVVFAFGKNWNLSNLTIDIFKQSKRKKSFFWLTNSSVDSSINNKEIPASMMRTISAEIPKKSENEETLQERKTKNYYDQIASMTKELFAMINDDIIYNEEKRNVIVDELTLSCIDNTMTKLFIIDPVMKRYSERTIDVIFTFLIFFCFNKSGVLHFLIGRNMGRIIEIFKVFPKLTLKFLTILARGINLFEIDASQHKQIPVLLNVIYIFIKGNIYEEAVENNINDIRECIIYTMDILYHLSTGFEIESLTKINLLIVEQLKKLISREKIQKMFPFENLIDIGNKIINNEDGSIYDDENDNICNKKKTEIKLVIKEDDTYGLAHIRDLFNKSKGKEYKFPVKLKFKRANYRIGVNGILDQDNLIDDNKEESFQNENSYIEKNKNSEGLPDNVEEKVPTNNENDNNNNINAIPDNSLAMNSFDNSTIITQHPFESKKLIHEQKFFFSLIKLLSSITHFFIMKNNTFSTFQSINDLSFFQKLLQENYLSLKDRTTLLVYLRMVYINDQIDENSSLILQKYMNSQEYNEAIGHLRILTSDPQAVRLTLPIEFFSNIKDKEKLKSFTFLKSINAFDRFDNIYHLKIVIEIFIHDLKNIFFYIYSEDNIEIINDYITQILFSVKIISDVFITYEISSHMTLWFYEITKEFLTKVNFFIHYLNTIKKSLSIEGIDITPSASHSISKMEKKGFDIYDTEKIYGFILEGFQDIYDHTDFNKNFKLSTFIKNYVDIDDKNFKTFTLNKIEIPFYPFIVHDDNENGIPSSTTNSLISEYKNYLLIKDIYLHQFSNFFKTAFYDLICCSSYEMRLDSNEIFLNYCVVYIYNLRSLPSESMVTFLTMLNKLLIYQPFETQKSLSKIFKEKNKSTPNAKTNYEEKFFDNLAYILQEKININIATCKNIVIFKRYEKINIATKILIQFFQLLGEGHNKDFHNLIISGIQKNSQNETNIFQILVNTLGHIINCFDSYQNLIMKGELPFDKLIVMTKNIIDFIIEYFQGTTIEKYRIMYEALKNIFPQIKSFIFYSEKKEDEENEEDKENTYEFKQKSKSLYIEKHNVIFSIKINLLELISSLIEEGNADNANLNTLTHIMENFSPVDLYEDVVHSFEFIVQNTNELQGYSLENEDIVHKLMEMYKYNDKFQNSIELKWALKIYYYMRVLSDVYDRVEVKSFLDNFKLIYDNAMKQASSNQSSKQTKKISFSISFGNDNTLVKGKEKLSYEKANYVIYSFLQKLLTRIEIKETGNESNKDFSFFVIPPICFLLSSHTIMFFNKYVDRDSVHSKIISLVNETDYFIYEMFYNNHHFRHYSKFSKFLSSMNISTYERVNYCFILLHNLFIMIHFYSLDSIDNELKNKRNSYNLILSIIHLVFIVIVLFVWFYYIFRLEYIHNIMKENGIKFIFRQSDDQKSHFTTLSESSETLLNNVTKQVSYGEKLSLFFIDSILLNRQINMLIATFICVAIYLISESAIALAIPVLFLANMNELLYGIILTVKLRWSQLLLVLTYTYLIVYLFAIIAFYYFEESIVFEEDFLEDKSDNYKGDERMCGSVLQCYLTLLNYGVRNGGGIGDVIIKLAFQDNIGPFISRFFFDILFHIIIILIMTNLIFGIIVDSFADLRNKNNELIYDKLNVCFICQMTRDSAMNKNIDFDMHRETVHNLWNYVYFLTYLHINNQNNFKMLESAVWNKIHKMDTSWIPTREKEDDKGSNKEEICLTEISAELQVSFMIRQDIFVEQTKMMDLVVSTGTNIMKMVNKKEDILSKKKMQMWIEQGCKKNVCYVKDGGVCREIIEKCENEKVIYMKISENIDGNERGKKVLCLVVIGPEDKKVIENIIGKKI